MPACVFKYHLHLYNEAVWYSVQGYVSNTAVESGEEVSGSLLDELFKTGQNNKKYFISIFPFIFENATTITSVVKSQ